jgi:YHS domain-containing protein
VTRVALLAVLLLVVAWAFWRLIDGVIETFGGKPARRGSRRPNVAVKLVRDPVCGTWVSPTNSQAVQVGSTVHHFCSDHCRVQFQKRG